MGYSRLQNVDRFTEEEYKNASEARDVFYRGRDRLHLHECQSVRHPMADLPECPPETIPFDFWEVCPFCRQWWRDGGKDE